MTRLLLATALKKAVASFNGKPFTVKELCRLLPDYHPEAVRYSVHRLLSRGYLKVARLGAGRVGHSYQEATPWSDPLAVWRAPRKA